MSNILQDVVNFVQRSETVELEEVEVVCGECGLGWVMLEK